MSAGYHNHVVIPLAFQGNITGGGAAAAVNGCRFYLPFKCQIVGYAVTCTKASIATTIHLQADGANVTTAGVPLISGTASGSTTTILGNKMVQEAGTILRLTENTAGAATLTNLSVVVWLRSHKA